MNGSRGSRHYVQSRQLNFVGIRPKSSDEPIDFLLDMLQEKELLYELMVDLYKEQVFEHLRGEGHHA